MTETAVAIAQAVRTRARSAAEVARGALARLDAAQPRLNAFLDTFHDKAVAHAQRVDEAVAAGKGESLLLAGVPVVLKDNICLGPDLREQGDGLGYGGRTTCGSRILENYRSPYTATAAQKLIDAGAIVLAKANLDEFAMGSSGEHSAFGPTRNPHDTSRVPGGSSSGSTAAVAAGVCPVALGSDTGGSIRQPAALSGIVGVKPTYGRVSRYGLVAFASSLDQIGPLTTSVRDAALVLEVICGPDPLDATSTDRPKGFLAHLSESPGQLRIGVPAQAQGPANHPAVAETMRRAAAALEGVGARIVPVDLPMTDVGIAAYYIVAPAEASSNLARFDGVRYGRRAALGVGEGLLDLYCKSRSEGFGAEVKRRIMLGTHVLSSGYYDAFYTTALKVRRRILDDYARAFAGCDAILMPTTPGPAWKLGEKDADPMAMYLEDVYTVGVNLAGLPAITLPAGFASVDGNRLPLGVQLIAPAFAEARMLQIAAALENALGGEAALPASKMAPAGPTPPGQGVSGC